MDVLKNLRANLSLPKVLKGLACFFPSLYLTAYVNANLYRPNSFWWRLPVFGCFYAGCWFVLRAARRMFQSDQPVKTVLLSVVVALVILDGFRGFFFPVQQEVTLSLSAVTAGEICLCDVIVDGENIPIAQVQVIENSAWLYREQYDNFVVWPLENGTENYLTMRFDAEEVRLGFPYTPYAGSVSIKSSAGSGSTWDLRCPEGEEVKYADIPFDCRRTYSPLELVLYLPGILSIISFLFLFFLYAARYGWQKIRL